MKGFLSNYKENSNNQRKATDSKPLVDPVPFTRPLRPAVVDTRNVQYKGPPLLPPDLNLPSIPPPQDLKVFSPVEALTILYTLIQNGNSKRKADAIRKKIRLHWIAVGLMPVKDSTFRNWCSKYVNNKPIDRDWRVHGCPRCMPVQAILDTGRKMLEANSGMAITAKDMARCNH